MPGQRRISQRFLYFFSTNINVHHLFNFAGFPSLCKRVLMFFAFVSISTIALNRQNYLSAQMTSGNLKASVVKTDITPDNSQYLLGYGERKSTGIHDRIYHRIVALDDCNTQFFIVSTEVCLFSPAFYDEVAEKVKEQLGIDPENLWWTVTHTHSAPEVGPPGMPAIFMGTRYQHEYDREYTDMVEAKLINGLKEAIEKLSPARLGVGWGFSQANINRRAIDVDGKASLGLNPDGPTDRRIGLLRIDNQDGTPLACIANYPVHGTVMSGENLLISGDAPGVVAEYFEQKIGVPLLFINGAAGNLAPIYSVYPNPRAGHLSQFRVLLGDRILDAYEKILFTTGEVQLDARVLTVETPRKQGLGWPDEFGAYTSTTPAGINLVNMPIRFLKINEDIAIWTAPVELFCEISNEIRDRSPFSYTFYFGYTNGWLGYLTTEKAYVHEGYEPGVSPFTPQAEGDLTEAVITYLKGEMKTNEN